MQLKERRFEGLASPEFYDETKGFDNRIAVMKYRDANDTLAMAQYSLAEFEAQKGSTSKDVFDKTIFLRHAISDLNCSFDLLLQIPWFYYRAWKSFNQGEELKSKTLKNRNNIVRNQDGWVQSAEKECSCKKIVAYLKHEQNPLSECIEAFYRKHIKNEDDKPTVRDLCNAIKHNHMIRFDELYVPCSSSKIPEKYKNRILCAETGEDSYEIIFISDDIEVGFMKKDEDFRWIDCINIRYKMDVVCQKCENFYNDMVDLLENVYSEIYSRIPLNPIIKNKKK